MGCYNGCGQLRQHTCPVCGEVFILPIGGIKTHQYVVVDKTQENYGKLHYCCSYKCFKKLNYENIIQKAKLTSSDAHWLTTHGYMVPTEKLPKWMQRELGKEGKNGI